MFILLDSVLLFSGIIMKEYGKRHAIFFPEILGLILYLLALLLILARI